MSKLKFILLAILGVIITSLITCMAIENRIFSIIMSAICGGLIGNITAIQLEEIRENEKEN